MSTWQGFQLIALLEVIQTDCAHFLSEVFEISVAHAGRPDAFNFLNGETPAAVLGERNWIRRVYKRLLLVAHYALLFSHHYSPSLRLISQISNVYLPSC
jgi:hypothetical protein